MSENSPPAFGYERNGTSDVLLGNITKMLRAPDGSLVLVGTTFGSNQSPDAVSIWRGAPGDAGAQFGNGSVAQPTLPGPFSISDAAVQADGKLVVVGSCSTSAGASEFLALRFNADSTLDTSFGQNGSVLTSFNHINDGSLCASVQSDGKIVLAGYTQVGAADGVSGYLDLALERLNSDGTPDPTFGRAGVMVDALGPAADSPVSIRTLANGKLLVLARSIGVGTPAYRGFHLLQFNADGSPDLSFGVGGATFQAISPVAGTLTRGMSIEPNGDIDVFGTEAVSAAAGTQTSVFLSRFHADGSVDAQFGVNGKLTVPAFNGLVLDTNFALEADGKLTLAGTWIDPQTGQNRSEFVRLNADGTPDAGFGTGGVAQVPGRFHLVDFFVRADGGIVATGDEGFDSQRVAFSPFIVRLHQDGTLDTSFTSLAQVTSPAIADVHARTVVLAPNSALLDLNNYLNYASGASLTVTRHGGPAVTDVFEAVGPVTFQDGIVWLDGFAIGTESVSKGTLSIHFGPIDQLGAASATPRTNAINTVLQHVAWQVGAQSAGATTGFDWKWDDGSGARNSTASMTTVVVVSDMITGTGSADDLKAAGWHQAINAGAGNDHLTGAQTDTNLIGGPGDDTIVGGGHDMAVYAGPIANYILNRQADGSLVVTDTTENEGTDLLVGINRVVFADEHVAFDVDGNAGKTYRLYLAAFNRAPDLSGLGFHIRNMDSGLSFADVANQFIASPEFQSLYGNPDDVRFVTLLYENVLHREPEAAGLQFHLRELAAGLTRAQELVNFSESAENEANVLGLISNGIGYL